MNYAKIWKDIETWWFGFQRYTDWSYHKVEKLSKSEYKVIESNHKNDFYKSKYAIGTVHKATRNTSFRID